MTDRDALPGDALPSPLRDAVELLRVAPEPGAAWRERVVRAAFDGGAGHRQAARGARSRVLAWTAIAAAVAGAVIGGSGVYLAMRHSAAPMMVAAPAPQPAGDIRVRFTFRAPRASAVAVVGDFNHWNPSAVPLRRSADQVTWEVEIPLAPGRYAYAYIVDGVLARDPGAPQVRDDDFGSANSILMVRGS